MQYRNGIFVVSEEKGCPLYAKGDEFRIKDMTLSITRGKPLCLSLLNELLPLLEHGAPTPGVKPKTSTRSPRTRRNQQTSGMECGGCTGGSSIRFEAKRSSEFATLQMRLLAAADYRAGLYTLDNGFAVLRKLASFAELDDDQLHAFCAVGEVQNFQPGETVAELGTRADRIFVVLSGQVILSDREEDSEDETVVELTPGELVGEVSLGTDATYTHNYYCLEPSSLLMVTVERVKAFLAKTPTLHVFLYHQLAKRSAKMSPSRLGPSGGFSANLKEMAVVDLCQLLNSSRKTGRVTLNLDDDTKGELLFNNGELIWAVHETMAGKTAFFSLLGRNDGSFNFVAGLDAKEMNLPVIGEFMGLIMEGMQKLDEQAAP